MKNLEAIMKELGIEIPEDKLEDLKKQHAENYKTVVDYDKQKEKVTELEATQKELKEKLEKFDGVDAEGLKAEIDNLKKTITDNEEALKKKDAEYLQKIADRDFDDSVEKAIRSKNGKNAKAIKALMDLDELRQSKNQQADIDKALDALVAAEDSKMLFGEEPERRVGGGNPIGALNKGSDNSTTTLSSALAEHYSK